MRLFLATITFFLALSLFTIPSRALDDAIACTEPALRDALQAGGEVTLAETCTYHLTLNLPSIDRDTQIVGNGATIDGDGQFRMLSTIGNVDLYIENLTLRNGGYGTGSALYAYAGDIQIVDSYFSNNVARFGSGGAIYMQSGTLTIEGSDFVDNHAQQQGFGGAIWVNSGSLSVFDSYFSNNTAEQGGAIFVQSGSVDVVASSFIDNEANISGGAAQVGEAPFASPYTYRAPANSSFSLHITNSTFSGNRLNGSNREYIENTYGGAIYSQTQDIYVTSSTIVDNIASIGGGLYFDTGTLYLQQSIVARNSVTDLPVDKALVSVGYNLIGDDENGRLVVAETDFLNLDPQLGPLTNGTYSLLATSPALDAIPSDVCATSVDQRQNQRPQRSGCDIGAVEMRADDIVVVGEPTATPSPVAMTGLACDETAVVAALQSGGTIELPQDCTLTLTQDLPVVTQDVVIQGHNTVIDGAGQYRLLYAPASASIEIHDLTLQNSPFPAVWSARGNVTVANSTLQNNGNDDEQGGAVYAGSGDITLENVGLTNNRALEGGAVYTYNGSITVHASHIENNQAFNAGGGLWASRGSIDIETSYFRGNIANNGSGGAVFSELGDVTVVTTEFVGNLAQYRERGIQPAGGAVYVQEGSFNVDQSTFEANSATTGGGVSATGDETTIQNSHFVSNYAQGEGGGLFTDNGVVVIDNSVFASNIAASGGAVEFSYSTPSLTATNSIFADNRVRGNGGAISGVQGSLDITNSLFVNNQGDWGGAIYTWGASTIRSSTFTGNQADEGGGLYSWGDLTLSQSIFVDNTANTSPEMGFHFMATFTSEGYNLIEYSYNLALNRADISTEEHGVIYTSGYSYTLAADSPALDAIPSDLCATATDLRGTSRPQGEGCDIGALEMLPDNAVVEAEPTTDTPGNEAVNVECAETALRDALQNAHYLSLAPDCTYQLSSDLPLISHSIVIDGNSATIDGGGQYRLFLVVANANLNIDNLMLRGGYSFTNGGAINLTSGTLSLTNCSIGQNTALIRGGALALTAGSAMIENCLFIDNTAQQGGAIYAEAPAVITNSTFTQNTAGTGGALQLYLGGDVVIHNSTFAGNQAESYGSGIFMGYGSLSLLGNIIDDEMVVQRGIFESQGYNIFTIPPDTRLASSDQTPENAGLGAFEDTYFPLQADSPAVDAMPPDQCPPYDQRGQERPQGPGCDIGAIEMVQDENFVPVSPAVQPQPEIEFVDLPCSNDALLPAIAEGGAYRLPDGCEITVTTTLTVADNDLVLVGNGVILDGDNAVQILHLDGHANLTLDGITLQNGVGVQGGAVYVESGEVLLHNTTFRNNLAENGGGIYLDEGDLVVTNSTFEANQAIGEHGGGGALSMQGDLQVEDSSFIGNIASGGSANNGGAIVARYGTTTIASSHFSGNIASFRGGAIMQFGDKGIFITGCTFDNNVALGQSESSGGAVNADAGILTIHNSLFYENTSTYGGAAYNDWGDLVVQNSIFVHNHARLDETYREENDMPGNWGDGGALGGNYGAIQIISSTIYGNTAEGRGGGVDMTFGSIRTQQSLISGNQAGSAGDINLWDGSFYSDGYNLFGSLSGRFPLHETDQIVRVTLDSFDPATDIPLPNGLMRDVIPASSCATEADYRGIERPQNEDCDIGAIEAQPDEAISTSATAPGSATPLPFIETFDDNRYDWEVTNDSSDYSSIDAITSDIVDGEYVISLTTRRWGWWVMPGFTDWEKAPIFDQPVEISVEVSNIQSSSNNIGISLFFNVGEMYQSYSGFTIFQDGTYIFLTSSGDTTTGIMETPVDLLDGETHILTIQADNDRYIFLVDGIQIVEIPAFETVNGTVALGVDVASIEYGSETVELTAHFDNLTVSALNSN